MNWYPTGARPKAPEISSPALEIEDLSRLGSLRGCRPGETLGLQTKLRPGRTEPLEGSELGPGESFLELLGAELS